MAAETSKIETTPSAAPTTNTPATETPAPAPAPEEVTEMNVLLSEGKRNYVCNEPHLALECFVDLCEKLAKVYGEESEKCTEAYLYYGKTLLDIARLENGVLGHAIHATPVFGPKVVDGVETGAEDDQYEDEGGDEDVEDPLKPEDIRSHVERAMREDNLYNASSTSSSPTSQADDEMMEDEEKEEKMEQDEEAKNENVESEKKPAEAENKAEASEKKPVETATEAETSESQKKEQDATKKPDENKAPSSSTSNTTKKLPSDKNVSSGSIACDESEGEEEEEEGVDGSNNGGGEVSNLQLSWEMLELTAVICKRQLDEQKKDVGKAVEGDVVEIKKTLQCTLAEAKHGLAQISVEMERYADAANDFTECLALYEEVIDEANSRVIAEAHYNIGLALSFDKKYTDAIERFEKAVSILKKRVETLETKVKDTEEAMSSSDADKDSKLVADVDEWKKEVEELNDLVVLDMMAKIEDARESQKLDTNVCVAAELKEGSNKENVFDQGFSKDAIALSDAQVRSMKRKNQGAEDGHGKSMKI